MPTFLIIDTALEQAIVALSKDGCIVAELVNKEANSHASFIQVAIGNMMASEKCAMEDLDAIVVTLGPGSYTGLRVGLASAKGIAYALQKPLIGLSTLTALAQKAVKSLPKELGQTYQVFSMIDARRMEVFGAIYDPLCNPIIQEQAIVLDEQKWNSLISQPTICIGNGSTKTKSFATTQEVIYQEAHYTSLELLEMATIQFNLAQFEDLAYVGPNYLKEVYILPSK